MDKIELTKEDFKKVCAECTKQNLDMLHETTKQKAKSDEDMHINTLMFLSKMMTLTLFASSLIKKLFEDDDNVKNM